MPLGCPKSRRTSSFGGNIDSDFLKAILVHHSGVAAAHAASDKHEAEDDKYRDERVALI